MPEPFSKKNNGKKLSIAWVVICLILVAGIITAGIFYLYPIWPEDEAVDSTKKNPSIVVIGSGPSGIAAASKLWKHNFTDVTILEAELRVGGRINSVMFGDAYVDLGGQWCHGEEGNIVYNMVKDLNILKHSNESTRLVYSDGKFIDEEIYDNLMAFADSIDPVETDKKPEGSCKDVSSVGECFEKGYNSTFVQIYKGNPEKLKISLEAYDWLENYLISYDSPFDLNDLSMITDYKICKGDLGLSWNGKGYKTILEIMLQENSDTNQQLPVVNNLLLNKEVTKIIWNNNTHKNYILCLDNTVYEADHVIFTASLGVLKASHDKIFYPELPNEKVKAIEGFGFGAIMKIILRFNTTWWNPHEVYGFVWSTEDKNKILSEFNKGPIKNETSWITTLAAFIPADNNPKVLIGFFAGEMIPEMEEESDEVLQDGCMYMLRKFLGKEYSVEEPVNMIKSTWYSNPHFRGTYSYESVTGNSTGSKFPEALAAPINRTNGYPSVQFAGEATHPYYFSTVHGAIETGYREADRIIDLYARK